MILFSRLLPGRGGLRRLLLGRLGLLLLSYLHLGVSQDLAVEGVSLLEHLRDHAVLVAVHGAQCLVVVRVELPVCGDLLEAVGLQDLHQVASDPPDALGEDVVRLSAGECPVEIVDDRQQILDLAFNGYGTLLGSSMYPAFSKYFDDELTNYYTYNTEKAKELLTEAGYPNGFDMTITVPSNYQSHMDTAQVIVEQLKAVGINAAIQPVTWESWVQDTYSNRQFQSTVVGVDASNMTARAMLERFVSTASRDFINYNNADYDALFAQAQACYDDGEQTALYRAMEKNLAENAANVYIQDMADFVAVRDGLEGPSFYPIYVLDLSTIHYTK